MRTISVVESSSEFGGGKPVVAETVTALPRNKRVAALTGILCIVPILALAGCWRSQAAILVAVVIDMELLVLPR